MDSRKIGRRQLLKLGAIAGSRAAMMQTRAVSAVLQPNSTPRADSFAPRFFSGIRDYDQAYNKANNVIASDIVDGKFIAGESWSQMWTRDTSIAIDLACGLIQPTVSKTTLIDLTEHVSRIGSCWLQDVCGHFGGWPNLTDAIVGTTGAWALYKVTGDPALLSWSYDITINSLKRAERDAYDSESGLFKGCSTFMESNSGYPKKYAYNGSLIGRTKALSTNVLYYNAYVIAARMARLLGRDGRVFQIKASRLKDAINGRLWMEDKGYYAYYEDENGIQNRHMEGCGESLAILSEVANSRQVSRILNNVPSTDWGIPCQWPQYTEWMNYNTSDANYYHNGMVWPFVQGYWAWSASKCKDTSAFKRELQKCLILSQKSDTFREFYRPEDGHSDGSRRQLWSAAGFLSMIYHGLFGMDFHEDGIKFEPVVPDGFGNIRLAGVAYRQSTLSITVRGIGSNVAAYRLDGQLQTDQFFSASLTGSHAIEIDLVVSNCRRPRQVE